MKILEIGKVVKGFFKKKKKEEREKERKEERNLNQ